PTKAAKRGATGRVAGRIASRARVFSISICEHIFYFHFLRFYYIAPWKIILPRQNYSRVLLTYRVFGWRCGANPVGADPLLVCLDEGQRERSGSRREYSLKMRVRSARQISRDGANPSGF